MTQSLEPVLIATGLYGVVIMSFSMKTSASAALTASFLILMTWSSAILKRATPSVATVTSMLPILYRYQPAACFPAGGVAALVGCGNAAAAAAPAATVKASRRVNPVIGLPLRWRRFLCAAHGG